MTSKHTSSSKRRNGGREDGRAPPGMTFPPRAERTEADQELMDAGMALCTHIKNMIIGAVNTEELQALKGEAGRLEQALLDAGTEPVPDHVITSMTPTEGPGGTLVTFVGTDFGEQTPTCAIGFGSQPGTIQTWTDTEITCIANRGGILVGELMGVWVVRGDGVSVQAGTFTFTEPVAAAPAITAVTPASGPTGTEIAVSGTNFGATQGAGWLAIGNDPATILTWSDTAITATAVRSLAGQDVPQTVTVSTADGQQATSAGPLFTFTAAAAPAVPAITGVVPTSGVDGSEVVINGTGFGAEGPNCRVSIGVEDAPIALWTDTAITVAAVQGISALDSPVEVEVVINDYQATAPDAAAMFTFTAA